MLLDPGTGERSRGRRVGKPARISVLEQVVVTVVSFDHGMRGQAHIAATAASWRRSWLWST